MGEADEKTEHEEIPKNQLIKGEVKVIYLNEPICVLKCINLNSIIWDKRNQHIELG